jgi:hypothetical protein
VSAHELDLAGEGRGEEAAERVPPRLLAGPYREARDAAMQWWERAYVRALSARHAERTKGIAAEAQISLGYLSKIQRR